MLAAIGEFFGEYEQPLKRYSEEAKALQKNLNEALAATEKARLLYHRAETEYSQAELALRR